MKAILTVIVLFGLLIVGCGGEESGQPPEPKKQPEPTTEPKEPEKEGVQPTEPTEDEKQPDFKEKFINNFKSYWAEAEEGDWALYVTHLKQLALFVVSRVEKKGEDKIVYMRKRWFYPDGREIPPTKDDQPEPPPISVEEDTEMEKRSMAGAHVNLREAEFVVPETKEKLLCIIRDSQKGEGEHAQTLYSTKVRCGGMLYTRVRPQGSSTATTYVVLLDYGDKNKSWEKSIAPGPEKVTKLFMMWDRYYDEKFEGEEDPEEGEPPEPPED